MNKEKALALIETLSNANGTSGFEDEAVAAIQKAAAPFGACRTDAMRNLYLHRKENTGARPVVQLDAHTDEVGFMVQAILGNGTAKFVPLGGWVPSTVPAHKVRVRNSLGEYIPGIVASKPPHFTSEAERKAAPALENMVIDVGACSKEEAAEKFHLRIGEPVVPEALFEYLPQQDIMTGKAFDCRLGCAALLATLESLSGKALHTDVVAAFSSQEEVGLRGARVTSAAIQPKAAIVFEATPADDTFSDPYSMQTAIKKGPMLRFIDASMIVNPRFQRFALDMGETFGLPVQTAVRTGGGTNGGAIHLADKGVPVIVIGLPVRYIHTHYGIASYADFECGVRLAAAILENLTPEILESF
ncbi:MAG: M42 family metallopeptidase [Oscillospiraceae bacterium]